VSIDMSENDLGDIGAAKFAESLNEMSLETLILNDNYITCTGAQVHSSLHTCFDQNFGNSPSVCLHTLFFILDEFSHEKPEDDQSDYPNVF
jgi:hypothetical protein